jgi:hypothetical protein
MPFHIVFAEGQAEQVLDTNNVTFAITSLSLSRNKTGTHVNIQEKRRARYPVKVGVGVGFEIKKQGKNIFLCLSIRV